MRIAKKFFLYLEDGLFVNQGFILVIAINYLWMGQSRRAKSRSEII